MTVPGFTEFIFEEGGIRHRVFKKGNGPGVLVLHELPGMTEQCIELGRAVAAEGFTSYLPLLFGKPGDRAAGRFTVQLCISREFRLFAKRRSSPIGEWLRSLCRQAHSDCGGIGVGAIGMCLTGNFAISLMVDKALMAPVASQPSLPLGLGQECRQALGMSESELERTKERAASGVPLLGLRFSDDSICPRERFDRLADELGPSFELIEIDSSPGNPHDISRSAHSVLTLDFVDQEGHPTHAARQRVFEFLRERLAGNHDAPELDQS